MCYLFVFFLLSAVNAEITGVITTCPACRLKKLPEVSKFLKEAGGIDQYPNLKVLWVYGADPNLSIFEDGSEIEKLSLESFTFDGMHKMVVSKGFTKKKNNNLRQQQSK